MSSMVASGWDACASGEVPRGLFVYTGHQPHKKRSYLPETLSFLPVLRPRGLLPPVKLIGALLNEWKLLKLTE